MSIYRFKRTSSGKVDTSEINKTNFGMSKLMFKNKKIVYFDFAITQQDVIDGYVYAIGKSSIAGASVNYNVPDSGPALYVTVLWEME